MSVTVHNPDQHMQALRTLIAQGRKRIGLLIGAGGPAGMADAEGNYPLIPAVEGLTTSVLAALEPKYHKQIAALKGELTKHDIETILSRIRSFASVLGASKVYEMDGDAFKEFGDEACQHIGKCVNVRLPKGNHSAYHHIVSWITGVSRDHPVEIFTTNYDRLFEEAFEANQSPFFDGFSGSHEPFFDPVSVASNDLPARWTRLWKLHGSLGWETNGKGEVIRTGSTDATHLVFPEHLKYDLTQKAPYSALLDRLRAFLETPDTLLITSGFSFSDSHISARIGEALASNPSASVFACQFKNLENEGAAHEIAQRRSNFTVYAKDKAVVNGVAGNWQLPAELPAKNWGPIRQSYWDSSAGGGFTLGEIENLARFVASSRSLQSYEIIDHATLPPQPGPTVNQT